MNDSEWHRVSRNRPCEICGKPDWCTYTDDGASCCMRLESSKQMANGGWLHRNKPSTPHEHRQAPIPKPEIRSQIDCVGMLDRWKREFPRDTVGMSQSLGVTRKAMDALNATWAEPYNAWAFPMRSGSNVIVGIRLRSSTGEKWAVKGSRQGIFIPQGITPQDVLMVCEGPTDTAAALSLGYYAVGRPNNICGGSEIAEFIQRLGVRRAIMVADNDDAGLKGSEKVGGELGVLWTIYCPPVKDIREFLRFGGTRKQIENEIRNTVWRRP